MLTLPHGMPNRYENEKTPQKTTYNVNTTKASHQTWEHENIT